MAARVLEVDATAPVVLADLTRPRPGGVGPVVEATGTDPAEGLVELGVGERERVVLRPDVVAAVGEVERDTVVETHGDERPHPNRRRQPEDLGQELGGRLLVPGAHDGVIQPDAHALLPRVLEAGNDLGAASVNVTSMSQPKTSTYLKSTLHPPW